MKILTVKTLFPNIQMDRHLMENNYRYDIFLSYTRNFIGDWVHEHFLELFCFHLQGSLGYTPTVFVDTQAIAAGSVWPLRLKTALAHSKCLVPVLSPSYFESRWCTNECLVMLRRAKVEGFGTCDGAPSLVLPVIASDGKFYPEYIKNIQSKDFRRFVRRGSGFTRTELYLEFQDTMEAWAEEEAEAIRQVPVWKQDWLDEATIEVPKFEIPAFDAPPRLG